MYTPDLSTASTLALTGAAFAWQGLAVGVIVLAGAAIVTTARVIRHRAASDSDLEAVLGLSED